MTKTLFDPQEGERLREEAIAQVHAHASPQALAGIEMAIIQVARERYQFTTDDVWQKLADLGGTRPREPRVMGPLMREASKNSVCYRSNMTEDSQRAICHLRPLRVWISLLFKRATP